MSVKFKLVILTIRGYGLLSKVMCILGFEDVPMGMHTIMACPQSN